jgi:hypothetical protein
MNLWDSLTEQRWNMKLDDIYIDLLKVVSKAGADVSAPIESERFFSRIVESFNGTREELLRHVEANLGRWFKRVDAVPRWLQEAEWQFDEDAPMVFIGQLNVPRTAGYFHDDAALFVFLNPKNGKIKTVIQMA